MQSETGKRLNNVDLDFYINSKKKRKDCKGLKYRSKPYTPQEVIDLNGYSKYKSSCKNIEKFQDLQEISQETSEENGFPEYKYNTSLVVETESPNESYLYEYKVNSKDEYYRNGEKITPFGKIVEGDSNNDSQLFLDIKTGKEYYYNAFNDNLVGYKYPETSPEQLEERLSRIESVSKTHRDFIENSKGSVKLKDINNIRRKLTFLSDNQVGNDLQAKEEYNKQLKELEQTFDNKIKVLEETEKNKDIEKILVDRNKLIEKTNDLNTKTSNKISDLENNKEKMIEDTSKIIGFYKNRDEMKKIVGKDIINNIDNTVNKSFSNISTNEILDEDFLKNEILDEDFLKNEILDEQSPEINQKNDEIDKHDMSIIETISDYLDRLFMKMGDNTNILKYILIFLLIFTISYYLVIFLNRSSVPKATVEPSST